MKDNTLYLMSYDLTNVVGKMFKIGDIPLFKMKLSQ